VPSLSDIDALVLAGGQGTRLRAVLPDRPKPLAEVARRPFLSYVLDSFAAAGIRRVTLCTGYRAEMVEAAFGRRYGPMSLSYSVETRPLGTAGAVLAALPGLRSPTILVANGDSLCQADLRAFAGFHRERACDASLLLTQVADASRFGRVEIGASGRIIRFVEKDASAAGGCINAGVYLIQQSALAGFSGTPLSLERDVFPTLIRRASEEPSQGRGVGGWRGGGEFLDIGTPESLAQAEEFVGQIGAKFTIQRDTLGRSCLEPDRRAGRMVTISAPKPKEPPDVSAFSVPNRSS
jgi:NDP-sugar pyrophosphorylase family protein